MRKLLAVLGLLIVTPAIAVTQSPAYLFSYFVGNGEDGLQVQGLEFPSGVRHGTAFEVPADIVARLAAK